MRGRMIYKAVGASGSVVVCRQGSEAGLYCGARTRYCGAQNGDGGWVVVSFAGAAESLSRSSGGSVVESTCRGASDL